MNEPSPRPPRRLIEERGVPLHPRAGLRRIRRASWRTQLAWRTVGHEGLRRPALLHPDGDKAAKEELL